jgi:hypothetical protein
MFILVNHSTDNGISEIGRYDTREEAATEIANKIINYYKIDLDIDDFLKEEHPYDNGDFRYNDYDANKHVWFNWYECNCFDASMEDSWIIIEI